jgi:two-component system, OmpR family, phosphate regulon sensor histidine kinase PhoR
VRLPRLRLPVLGALAVLAVAAVCAVIVLQTVQASLADAGANAPSIARVSGRLTAVLMTVTVLLAAGGYLAGRGLTVGLARLRAGVLGRARGDGAALPDFQLRELHDLAGAIDRLSARDAAREAEARAEHAGIAIMLDAISDGILHVNGQGRVLRFNPAAAALLGVDASAVGEPVEKLVRHSELRGILQRAAAGAAVGAAEIALDERRLLVSARPMNDAGGDADGAVVVFVDLTQLRRLEGVRRDFVANVSHELKTPLTSIRGYVETLLEDDALPVETRRQFLDVVRKNAERLQHIVDDLLDLSRLESGGWRPELQVVDARSIIDDVWSGCSARAAERRITFTAPAGDVPVLADPGGLRQVLANLLDNALRHTPEGGSVEVAACVEPAEPGLVAFEVRDTGAGIPSDALSRIFERFFRVDPARSRADGGTGLGLSVVKHLVESMGGDVSAESELGRGTTIRFRLPAVEGTK